MILGIAGLIACYVLLALLLLSISLYSNLAWYIKALTVVITSAFYIVSYLSFPPILGWPTSDDLPARFKMISAFVEQPDKKTSSPGAIYLWLQDIEYINNAGSPRAYKLPYTAPLHESIINVKEKLSRDIPQIGEFKDKPNGILDVPEQTRKGQKSLNIQFYDLPDPLFPDK